MSMATFDSGRAPGFVGPEPPDSTAMTFGESLQAVLNRLMAGQLSPQEQQEFKAFMIGVQQIVMQQQQAAQQGAAQQQGAAGGGAPGAVPAPQPAPFGQGFGGSGA